MTTSLRIGWRPRTLRLAPSVALAHGEAARRLALRLVDRAGIGSLRAVVGSELLCVLGDEASLPWIDGVEYLGRDPRAPALRLPTTVEPDLAPELVERALIARAGMAGLAVPLAVTHAPPRLFSLSAAAHVSPAGLRLWLERS